MAKRTQITEQQVREWVSAAEQAAANLNRLVRECGNGNVETPADAPDLARALTAVARDAANAALRVQLMASMADTRRQIEAEFAKRAKA